MIENGRADFRPRLERVADHALRMQVLRLPAPAIGAERLQARRRGYRGQPRRRKIGELVFRHEVGPQRQHDRRLDLAAMNAVPGFLLGDQSGRQAEIEPIGQGHEHLMLDPEIARHELADLRLAAMAVKDQELLHAGPPDRQADLEP